MKIDLIKKLIATNKFGYLSTSIKWKEKEGENKTKRKSMCHGWLPQVILFFFSK